MPTTRDTPEAALAAALRTTMHNGPTSDAAAILAAMPVWTLVNEERLAIALHYAMCDVSHHDGGPMGHGCHNWPKYPAIARTTMRALSEPNCGEAMDQ